LRLILEGNPRGKIEEIDNAHSRETKKYKKSVTQDQPFVRPCSTTDTSCASWSQPPSSGTAEPTATAQDGCACVVLASVRRHGYSSFPKDAIIPHGGFLDSIFGTFSTKHYQAFTSCFRSGLALTGTCSTERCNLEVEVSGLWVSHRVVCRDAPLTLWL